MDGSDSHHHVSEGAQVPALPLLGLHFTEPQFLLLSYYPVGGIEAQNNAELQGMGFCLVSLSDLGLP